MNEMIICGIVGIIQIFLSIYLIVCRKNATAILSEIVSSLILLYVLNFFQGAVDAILWRCIGLTLLEYLSVKIFLFVFMLIARMYCFYAIKGLSNKKKKTGKKIGKNKLKFIRKFSKVKYWPRLKLGLPGKAGKRHAITKVKFDEKGFPAFKSYYTVKLRIRDYHKTREQHFYIASKMLYENICSNSRLRAKFSSEEIKAFARGETPKRYTWHHYQDAGILQLVEYDIHSKTSHVGGYSIWGGK